MSGVVHEVPNESRTAMLSRFVQERAATLVIPSERSAVERPHKPGQAWLPIVLTFAEVGSRAAQPTMASEVPRLRCTSLRMTAFESRAFQTRGRLYERASRKNSSAVSVVAFAKSSTEIPRACAMLSATSRV